MKIQANRAALVEALGFVAGCLPSKTTKEILYSLHLVTGDSSLIVTGTDLEVSLTFVLENVNVIEPGSANIPAKSLLPVVRESGDEQITVSVREGHCTVALSDGHFDFNTFIAEEYPEVIAYDDKNVVSVAKESLVAALTRTIFATTTVTSKYVLSGLRLAFEEDRLTVVGTDLKRLAVAYVPLTGSGIEPKEVIVPTKGLSELIGIAEREDSDVIRINLRDNFIVFKTERAELGCQLLEGRFPPFRDALSIDTPFVYPLKRTEFLSKVRRAALFANDKTLAVKLDIADGRLVLYSRDMDRGTSEIWMPIDDSPGKMSIGFNPVYIQNCLAALSHEEVELKLKSSETPGMITPRGDDSYVYVAMPVSLDF